MIHESVARVVYFATDKLEHETQSLWFTSWAAVTVSPYTKPGLSREAYVGLVKDTTSSVTDSHKETVP